MDILKIGCIITAVFCLHAESQDCFSTYTCPLTRGDRRQDEIECEKLCDFISDCYRGTDEAQCGTLCTFENDTCNWETISSNQYTWVRGSGELLTDQRNLGPAQDKSAGNSTGGYFYVREDGSGTASLAELHGPTLHNTAETCRFSFYYHLSESDAWQLQVFLKTNYTTVLIKDFGSDSTGSRLWRKKYATIGGIVGFGKVIFRASKLPDSVGAVAIDYIKFDTELCALPYDDGATCASDEWPCDSGGCIPEGKLCDFVRHCRDGSDEKPDYCADKNRCDAEVDFCNFTSSGDAVFQRVLASTVPADSNWPVIDHTYMSPEGSYFAVNGSSGGTRAVFLGPAFKGTTQGETECKMSLFYYLAGASSTLYFGFRTRYSKADNTPASVSHSSVQAWKKNDVTFDSSTDFLPLLVAELGDGGVLAIDDIIFSEEVITDRCTFEDEDMPLCSWQQDSTGSFQWGVTEAIVAGRMGAIKVDHTDQLFTGKMILWYHLGGSNTNKLSVYTRTADAEGALQLEWRVSGDKGLTWNEAVIAINQTSIFQIVIEGSAGTFTTRMDHVGVDDIGFNIPCIAAAEGETLPSDVEDEGDCSDVEYSCTDGTCVLNEPGNCPMECTFDEGLCGWKNDVTAGSQWSLSEPIPAFGPTSDRTSQDDYNQCSFDDDFCIWQPNSGDEIQWTMKPEKRKRDPHMGDGIPPNDGSFIQAEFKNSMKGKKSTLHSYLISSTDDKCELRFVYFTESSTSLRVLLRHSLGEGNTEQVWTSSMSGAWQRAVVSLSSDEPFEVVFEANSVSIEGGVIGIDSTSFTPSCDITEENLKTESKGSGLTAGNLIVPQRILRKSQA
ncbi:MAM and LDL-receptor class A domain-containing protein 2 [Holothuria leucospilota]|uniref:MAM and LDL-receptor class A domain-containing protein 2 n=1 Tax=Holothuria leucospilota TaxID=206669 RepID=A0A9Q1BXS7_HOLLE|nr:MAM and LDL-receptor class A domain-containing protein 2 [Holothuria leucospilota]